MFSCFFHQLFHFLYKRTSKVFLEGTNTFPIFSSAGKNLFTRRKSKCRPSQVELLPIKGA